MMADECIKIKEKFTAVPNNVMKALAMVRIPGEARQVLDAIMRKMYGFHKTKDEISLSQFMAMTGMRKVTVSKALRRLLDMNVITKLGNKCGMEYSIQAVEAWRPLAKKKTIVTNKGNGVTEFGNKAKELPNSVISVTQLGNNRYPIGYECKQKKVLKESLKRKSYNQTSSEIRLSKLLDNLIRKRHKGFKSPNFQKWAGAIDRMIRLDKHNANDIEAVIRWSQQDSFWQNNILSTEALRKQYDQLFLKMKSGKHSTKTNGESLEDRLKAGDKKRERLGMNT